MYQVLVGKLNGILSHHETSRYVVSKCTNSNCKVASIKTSDINHKMCSCVC